MKKLKWIRIDPSDKEDLSACAFWGRLRFLILKRLKSGSWELLLSYVNDNGTVTELPAGCGYFDAVDMAKDRAQNIVYSTIEWSKE